MSGRAVRGLLVAAFAVALGHLAWRAGLGPPLAPDYLVSSDGVALAGTDPQPCKLYLRRELYLSQRPRYAWLQVVACDRVRLYVNGRFLAGQHLDGMPVAVLVDLAPY